MVVKKGNRRTSTNIFVSTTRLKFDDTFRFQTPTAVSLATMLCSDVFSNGDNERPQSGYA